MAKNWDALDLGKFGTYTLQQLEDMARKSNAGTFTEAERSQFGEIAKRSSVLNFLEYHNKAGTEEARLIARNYYDRYVQWLFSVGHPSVCNELFFVTNRFGLDILDRKRMAATVVWNGRHGYYEWIQHNTAFDNTRVFVDMGIITESEAGRYMEEYKKSGKTYCFIDPEVEKKLISRLKLTEAEILGAPMLVRNIWEKEVTDNRNSGQYSYLPLRNDLVKCPYSTAHTYALKRRKELKKDSQRRRIS